MSEEGRTALRAGRAGRWAGRLEGRKAGRAGRAGRARRTDFMYTGRYQPDRPDGPEEQYGRTSSDERVKIF